MDNAIQCHYCSEIIDSDDFLSCEKCGGNVHTKCLKRPGTPGDLLGDVFFIFTCALCTSNGREIFIRQKLPWLMIVAITIYNLSIQSNGLSHHGYFHWRSHITNFIDKNWDFLFPSTMRRKKKWIGTVSGILSHNSPEYFISGQNVIQESGWWKLTYNQTPKFYMKLYEQLSSTRQQLRNDKRKHGDYNFISNEISNLMSDDSKRLQSDSNEEEICSRMIPYMGRPVKIFKKENVTIENTCEMSSVQSNLKEFLEENLAPNDLLFNDIPKVIDETEKVLSLIDSTEPDDSVYNLWNSELSDLDYENEFIDEIKPTLENDQIVNDNMTNFNENQQDVGEYSGKSVIKQEIIENSDNDDNNTNNDENDDYDHNIDNDCGVRIIQVTNFQQLIKEEPKGDDTDRKDDEKNENKEKVDDEFVCEKSLFTKHPKREFPWKEEEEQEETEEEEEPNTLDNNIQMMSEYEEKLLFNQLEKIFDCEVSHNIDIPSKIRRFYRKLYIRNYKRNNLKPVFNLDTFGEKHLMLNNHKKNILDRYYELSNNFCLSNARISGPIQNEFFESPYTSRILHPFIYRHSKLFPPWLKVMCELQYVVTGNRPSRSTIDFCYIRPNHIPAVNALLQSLFWPGIDMSESLSYPDFTVVALYKKLIIGCGFLVPDVGHNEAYISFMAVRPGWQRSGIASFMLYHLTQTCMGKDITLHVSATNSAVCLYQKFGFKMKEIVLDFYEKYLPIDSKHSRHALFLRLSR